MKKPTGFKGFTIMSVGQIISMTGSAMTQFGLSIWIWEKTGNATPFSIITTAFFIPSIIFSPFAGALIDRWPRKRSLILPDVAAGLVTITMLILLSINKLDLWFIYVASFIEGLFNAFQWPAYSVTISVMLKKEEYGKANGLFQMTDYAPMILAPLIAGFLLSIIGIKGIMSIDIATFLLAVAAVLWVVIPENAASKEKAVSNLFKDAIFGFRFILKRKPLLLLLTVFLVTNFLGGFVNTLFAPMILTKVNNSSALYGIVQTSFGVGGIFGGVLMTAWGGTKKKIKSLLWGILVSGLGVSVLGFTRNVVWLCLAEILMSVSAVIANSSSQAIWQTKVKPELQGRVFSARRVVAQLVGVIPMVASGPLVDHLLGPFVDHKIVLNALFGIEKGGAMSMLAAISGVLTILAIIGFSLIPMLMNVEEYEFED
ncbi:MAG: MFS transporter [Caldisericaceae bacterium]